MRIDITGYVTEPLVGYSFKIKVTSNRAELLSDIQVQKEVRCSAYAYLDHNFAKLR